MNNKERSKHVHSKQKVRSVGPRSGLPGRTSSAFRRVGQERPHPPRAPGGQAPRGAHLQQARDDVCEELQQGLLGDPLDDFGLHLDGGQVDGVVGRLDDGAQHFDALLWVDGAGQRGCGLLGSPHHLKHTPG